MAPRGMACAALLVVTISPAAPGQSGPTGVCPEPPGDCGYEVVGKPERKNGSLPFALRFVLESLKNTSYAPGIVERAFTTLASFPGIEMCLSVARLRTSQIMAPTPVLGSTLPATAPCSWYPLAGLHSYQFPPRSFSCPTNQPLPSLPDLPKHIPDLKCTPLVLPQNLRDHILVDSVSSTSSGNRECSALSELCKGQRHQLRWEPASLLHGNSL